MDEIVVCVKATGRMEMRNRDVIAIQRIYVPIKLSADSLADCTALRRDIYPFRIIHLFLATSSILDTAQSLNQPLAVSKSPFSTSKALTHHPMS